MKRESVIGLEIHLQLKTKTKLFCSCSSDYIGATPNTNVCPVCLAVPGTLPILNDHAVELGVKMRQHQVPQEALFLCGPAQSVPDHTVRTSYSRGGLCRHFCRRQRKEDKGPPSAP